MMYLESDEANKTLVSYQCFFSYYSKRIMGLKQIIDSSWWAFGVALVSLVLLGFTIGNLVFYADIVHNEQNVTGVSIGRAKWMIALNVFILVGFFLFLVYGILRFFYSRNSKKFLDAATTRALALKAAAGDRIAAARLALERRRLGTAGAFDDFQMPNVSQSTTDTAALLAGGGGVDGAGLAGGGLGARRRPDSGLPDALSVEMEMGTIGGGGGAPVTPAVAGGGGGNNPLFGATGGSGGASFARLILYPEGAPESTGFGLECKQIAANKANMLPLPAPRGAVEKIRSAFSNTQPVAGSSPAP
jgi:hypothetical protein